MFKLGDRHAVSLVRRLIPEMKPFQGYFWVMVSLLFLQTPLHLVMPLILKRVVDNAMGTETREDLTFWALVLVGLTLLSVVLGVIVGYCTVIFRHRVYHRLRIKIHRHMQRFSLRYYSKMETGHLMSRQLDDVANLGGIMADALGQGAVNLVRAVACVGMLFYVEWRMALGGLVLAAVMFGFQYSISPVLRRRNRQVRDYWTEVSEALHQSISGHYLVQATASEQREALRFSRVLHQAIRTMVGRDLLQLATGNVFTLITGLLPTLIVLGGVFLILTSDFTVGGLFAFYIFLQQMFEAVGALTSMNPRIQFSLSALERIYEVLDTEPDLESPEDGLRPGKLEGLVVFDSLTFAYNPGQPVLRGIDLEVPPCTMVALVGPSGAGKTTLAHLIPRFYDPVDGRILVDGHDLRNLDLQGYRQQVGIVPQEVFLFDRTVAENLAYGKPRATHEEVRAAAEAANALEFIEGMEKGFDTVIGERGVRLSGGQRQRLAIAREILRDPSILILDEATSSLDSRSEALVQEALYKLLAGRTSFVIAHRLSTILRADLIVVLEDGRIVERGRHQELLEAGGLYAGLYHSQFLRHLEPVEEDSRALPGP